MKAVFNVLEMIMSNKTGGPAFPNKSAAGNGGSSFDSSGMTLRDYFAANAIIKIDPPIDFVGKREASDSYKEWAKKAYRMADAMLRAREAS